MALIHCPECSQEVSDQAAACPHCGYPLQAQRPVPNPVPDGVEARLRQTLLSQGKIAAVKLCRKLHPGISLAEAKGRVDQVEAGLPQGTYQRAGGSCLLAAVTLAVAGGCAGYALRVCFG